MTEKLLQYIWQMGYFNQAHLETTSGEVIKLLSRGSLNQNAGPDFLNARIQIGTTTLAGSVELHIHTSDWEKHKHSSDEGYKNVILHAVYKHDKNLSHAIPVLELQPLISTVLLHRYESLMENKTPIACSNEIASIKELTWTSWKERLLIERLVRKAEDINHLLSSTNFHWEERLWWQLARNFGTKVNADAFEAVAKSIPVNLLAKHKQSIHQAEALLFGQAGLLQEKFDEHYPNLLQREYLFLQKKYGLKPGTHKMHFLRMRPGNFPTIRLAQLAMLVHTSLHLFSKILETQRLQEVYTLLQVTANDYWNDHYRFDEPSAFKPKNIGTDMADNIIINTIIPLLFAYGQYYKNDQYKLKAVQWMEEVKGEHNAITSLFAGLSIKNKTAYDSQAFIQLKNEYCDKKRCLQCAVGNAILKRENSLKEAAIL